MEPVKKSTMFIHKMRTTEKLDKNERILAVSSGTLLSVLGIRSGGLSGFIFSTVGGALSYIGLTADNPFYNLGTDSDKLVSIRQSVLINKDRQAVFNFWRDLKNLPRVLRHIKKVDYRDEAVTHWEAELGSIKVSWDAEMAFDEVNWRILWNSLPKSEIRTTGRVDFEYAGEDYTRLNILIGYEPRLGRLGYALAKALNPIFEEEVREDIMKMKKLFEAG